MTSNEIDRDSIQAAQKLMSTIKKHQNKRFIAGSYV
jgi:hypothetical protein